VRARRRFGQHFLSPAWADRVADAIAPRPDDRFLEIGPGPGALTMRLAPRVAHLTAVEVDRDLARALAPQLPANAEVVTADILDFDLTPLTAAGPLRVAGNLPYNISSPILFKFLKSSECGASEDAPCVRDATVMLQRELADRLVAVPGTKDYGVLTIFAGAQADAERILTLPPGAFTPPPAVHSALVRLTFRRSAVPDELRAIFERMVRSIFTQRRKTLGNALRPFAESVGQSSTAVLQAARIDPNRRAETLDLDEMIALARSARPAAQPNLSTVPARERDAS
jgi:16S rRNA (adenine1518-N6/adenine1519-N6)-dimethyltransferase